MVFILEDEDVFQLSRGKVQEAISTYGEYAEA
jgi:hypothetical protein